MYDIGLMGKSKAQMMRVAAVLHALFCLDTAYELTAEISADSVKAAINLVDVCNEHTRIFAGRTDTSSGPTTCKYSMKEKMLLHVHVCCEM